MAGGLSRIQSLEFGSGRNQFTELKQAALPPDRSEFIDVVRTIFHLQEDSCQPVSAAVN